MPAPIRVLVALDGGTDRNSVEAVLPVESGIELAGVADSLEHGWTELSADSIDAVLVVCAGSADRALAFTESVASHHPDRAVLLLYAGSPNGVGNRALAAGAEDLVAMPVSNGEPPAPAERVRVAAELHSAIEKAVARRRRATTAPQVRHARSIVVLGPKGGAGKTLVSSSVAVAMAEAGEQVVLLDLDLQFGDAALTLGLTPTKTIYDLVRSGGSLDAEKLADYLVPHESGLRVLQAPARPDQAASVTVAFLRELFDVLRTTVDWIVVDCSPGFTPEVIAAIDAATDICMVGTVDAAALKNTKLGLETLERMGVPPERVTLVLNRSDSRIGITPEDVHAVTGRRADVLIPSHRDVARASSEARPIVTSQPTSHAARALQALADSYRGAGSVDSGGGSLRRLLGRRR